MQEKELSPVEQFYVWLEEELEELATNGPKVKRGRKPSKKQYFTYINEKAIVAFNKETNQHLRNKVFKEHIYKPFDKLVENLIHTFKFYYFDVPYTDVKAEVVAFLVEKIHKFTEGKGKAFSYFSIIAKNYLIIANNANYAKLRQKADLNTIDERRNIDQEISLSDHQESLRDFTNLWIDYYDTNMNAIFSNRKDIVVADTILEIFRMRENIENFNKKALYILIRERTGLKTQNITKVINVMKRDYSKMYITYKHRGRILSTNR